MYSNAVLRAELGPTCYPRDQLDTVEYDHRRFYVRPETVAAFRELFAVFEYHGYSIDDGVLDDWSYNCRDVTNAPGIVSFHGLGTAIDVNATQNPYGSRLVTDMSAAMIADVAGVRTRRANRQVFRWGGSYSKNKDAMHFEVVVLPQDLAGGLVRLPWSPLPEELTDMPLTGADLDAIEQRVLNAIDHKFYREHIPGDPHVDLPERLDRIQEAVRTGRGATAYNAAQSAADQSAEILAIVKPDEG